MANTTARAQGSQEPGANWPSRLFRPSGLAYTASLVFMLASGATNLLYGWNKGNGDFGSSLVWSAVSVAVSIVFALSWPAVIRSVDRQQWSRVAMSLAALLLTGTYSVSAALGSAMGGRENAAIEQSDTSDKRKKAQALYDAAELELKTLPPSRSVEEMKPIVDAAKCQRRVVVTVNGHDTVCVKDGKLTAELGRAERRAKLEKQRDSAQELLNSMKAGKVANADAAALSLYLEGLGWTISEDRLNKLLGLLAVLIVECGGGLALAVGMALREDDRTAVTMVKDSVSTSRIMVSGSNATRQAEVSSIPDTTPVITDAASHRHLVLGFLQQRGGVFVGGQRAMAAALGWSKSWTNGVLHDLAKEGMVQLTTGKTGTVVRLSTGARKAAA